MKKKKKYNFLKKNKFIINLILLFVITIAVGFLFVPLLKNTSYGLDLKGGFEVLYQVDTVDDSKLTDTMVTNTYKTILKRIDVLGVTEPNISIEGNDKIRIQLAGITNADEAREILSTTANLTFRDINDNLIMNSDVLISGGATSTNDSKGSPAVGLSVSDKDEFYSGTKKISEMDNNLLVIWLDYNEEIDSYEKEGFLCGTSSSNCLSAATVSEAFSSDVIIQGNFKRTEVDALVELINSGSLPTKLNEISSKTVDAAFGEDSLNKTFIAGVIGVSLIIITMLFLYHFAAIITGLSIIIYSFLVFLLFYLIGGVLTLPGIAALVIGIGMAVDANVITYSRIKDELYNGRTLTNAFIEGNKRSLKTILDANVTTFLVAIVLFIFGESSVKGFATMFMITIIVTVFVMFFITRTLLKKFVDSKYFDNKLNLFVNVKNKFIPNVEKNEVGKNPGFVKINFINKRKIFFSISIFLILLGFIATLLFGLNLGIDYKGGSSVTILTEENISNETLKNEFKDMNYEVLNIDKLSNGYEIKITNELDKNEVISTANYFEEKYNASTDIGVISNIVKEELIRNAIISIIIASIGLLIYLIFRYQFGFAISGVVALFHDIFIVIGVFALFQIEVDSIFIAAILAIIGYSINDTIVCFDRINETIKNRKKEIKTSDELKDIVNTSVSQIFERSIITSLTTLIPILTLLIFGSHEIYTFNIALFIGLISGTYSSIFIAANLWYIIEKKKIGKKKKSFWDKYIEHDELEELKIKGINS